MLTGKLPSIFLSCLFLWLHGDELTICQQMSRCALHRPPSLWGGKHTRVTPLTAYWGIISINYLRPRPSMQISPQGHAQLSLPSSQSLFVQLITMEIILGRGGLGGESGYYDKLNSYLSETCNLSPFSMSVLFSNVMRAFLKIH